MAVGKNEGSKLGIAEGIKVVGKVDGANEGIEVGRSLGAREGVTVGRIVLTIYTAFDQPPPHNSPVVPEQGIVHTQFVVVPVQPGPH